MLGALSKMIKSVVDRLLPAKLHPRSLANNAFRRLQSRGRVLAGPFRGMRYGNIAIGSEQPPKVFGTYEKELWPLIHDVVARRPKSIVDVGAAEGYYAVGLATRLPSANVIAFELSKEGRDQLKVNAEMNKCADRIHICGKCGPDDLRGVALAHKPAVVIVDVEGAEDEILSPDTVQALESSKLIVELHEWVVPNIKELLTKRFQNTHASTVIQSRRRTVFDLPKRSVSGWIYGRWWKGLLDEKRPCTMEWLILEPKRGRA